MPLPYSSMLFAAYLNSLASRREDMSRNFFHDITKSTPCLRHLLPDPKSPSHNSRLMQILYKKFPRPYTRTKRYCSFVGLQYIRTEPLSGQSISNRQIRFLFSTNPTTPHTSHCNIYLERCVMLLLYCIIVSFIVF